ncbi:hypothetical protein [Hazenella coriacea]|uniref:hypothetical protein n=1 Tax=Hazenella coriacea TaxID=1179467 RepID=UPI001048F2CC|nr:hypothetical protein [Hazenella coriacea]
MFRGHYLRVEDQGSSNVEKIDPEGKGIHLNTIRKNEKLYEYYKQHSLPFEQKVNGKNVKL